MLKTIHPPNYPLRLQQARKRLASSCTQEITDTSVNPVNFQNKNTVGRSFCFTKSPAVNYDVQTYACVNSVFSPEPGSKKEEGKGE